jgi:microcystin-dependent protein
LVAQESTVKQDLAELRDELLPALVAEGGGLVMTKGSTTLTIRLRANPYFFQSQKESARLHFDSGAKLLLYCDDKLNRVSNVQIDDPKWSSLLATKELEGADKGIILNEAYGLSADDQITLTLKLMALGEPRLTSLRIRCQDVNKGSENFTLRVPLFVGPLLAVDDTLALTGQLGLGQPPDEGEAPLRLFKDDGWNFTLEDDDKSAFRIGSADAKSADGMTHFVARDGGVEIGGFETDKDTSISLRSAEAKHVGIRFQQGRVDKGFVLGTTEVISTVETAGKVESSKNQPSSAEQILLDMDWETFCHWFEEYMSTYELDADDDPLDAGEELKDRLYRHFDDEEIEVDTDLAAALGRIVDIFIDQGSDEYSVLSAIDEYKMEISRSTSGNKSISKRGNARSSGFLLSHESPGQSPSKRTDLFIDEKNGNIGVGTVQPTAELHVQGRIKDETGWVMPKGAIIMWTGDKAPEGWTLCDGTKGAPNLQSRFIVGIGPGNNLAKEQSDSLSAYGVGKKGGREYVPLTTDHLANHSHVVTDPSHTHQVINKDTQKGYGHGHGFETQGASYTPATQNSSLPANSRVQADSQRTGISIKSAGKGKAHENLPPYYALAFIMKL